MTHKLFINSLPKSGTHLLGKRSSITGTLHQGQTHLEQTARNRGELPLPNLVIAGAPRSGTTALFKWLIDHPSVVSARIKETRYLMDKEYPLYNPTHNFQGGGLSGYAQLFPSHPYGSVYLDATPDYMYQQTALEVLSKLPTNPTIIFVLRNPVERVISLFNFAQNNVGTVEPDISLEDFIAKATLGGFGNDTILNKVLDHSVYHTWLEKWIQACGSHRVKVIFFEDMVKDPLLVLVDICTHFGINADFYFNYVFEAENASGRVRSKTLRSARNFITKEFPKLLEAQHLVRAYHKINIIGNREKIPREQPTIRDLYKYFEEPNFELSLLLAKKLPASWSNLEPT